LEDSVAIARHEICCTLKDVIKTAGELLKNRGRFYMVHLAERLADIISIGRESQLEPKAVRMVHSFLKEPAKLVLIQMTKGAKPSLSIMPPLIIYERPGCYTEEVYRYYYPEGIDV
jgi:tRNA1Val (adenine37-N6)-methyltransferase